jgi:hypothetical protein
MGKKRGFAGQLTIKDMFNFSGQFKKRQKTDGDDIALTLTSTHTLASETHSGPFETTLSTPSTDSHFAVISANELAMEVAESIHVLEHIASEASKLAASSSTTSKDVDALRSRFNSIIRPHSVSILRPPLVSQPSLTSSSIRSCLQLALAKPIQKDDPTIHVTTKSTTARELFELSPQQAAWSLHGMCSGYASKSGPIAPAELRGPYGCWISQARTHLHGGHCQMIPWLEAGGPRSNVRLAGGLKNLAKKRQPQTLHRLSVRAWKPLSEVRLILEDTASAGTPGFEVSHLCHQPGCFNPDHLVIERKARNNLRNECAKSGRCICCQQPSCLV